ncbi:MAG: DUF488 domain-containing protein [Herpetosiphon sp.]|nr:DUF488 domain-containing protein [Herpetosiphon sp.]
MPALYTIGYEKTTIDAVLATLLEHNIKTVIDVRRNPISRKAGFSKKQFAQHLHDQQIKYEHLVELGAPRELRQQFKSDGDLAAYFAQFDRYLHDNAHLLDSLVSKIKHERCVLVCFERDYQQCHRSLIADHLKIIIPNLDVIHVSVAGD